LNADGARDRRTLTQPGTGGGIHFEFEVEEKHESWTSVQSREDHQKSSNETCNLRGISQRSSSGEVPRSRRWHSGHDYVAKASSEKIKDYGAEVRWEEFSEAVVSTYDVGEGEQRP